MNNVPGSGSGRSWAVYIRPAFSSPILMRWVCGVMPTSTRRGASASTTVWRAVGRASTVAASVRLLGTICVYTESSCSHTSVGTVGAVRQQAVKQLAGGHLGLKVHQLPVHDLGVHARDRLGRFDAHALAPFARQAL